MEAVSFFSSQISIKSNPGGFSSCRSDSQMQWGEEQTIGSLRSVLKEKGTCYSDSLSSVQ